MELRLGALCVMVLSHVAAQQETRYAELSNTLELVPEIPAGTVVTALLWKHGLNKVMEWDIQFSETQVYEYGTYKGRTTMDLSTGRLVINALTREDNGVYSIELNNKLQPDKYTVVVISSVLKPVVSFKPLACGPHHSFCLLSCDGGPAVGAEPITYSWRTDEGDWRDLQKDNLPNITNDEEMKKVKTFSCKLKNPVSEEQSEPQENPFHSGGGNVGKIVGGILGGILGVLVLSVAAFIWKFDTIKERFPFLQCIRRGVTTQPPEEQPLKTTESHPNPTHTVGMTAIPDSSEGLSAPEHTTNNETVNETDRHNTETDRHNTETDRHNTETDRHNTETDRHNTETDRHNTETDRHNTDVEVTKGTTVGDGGVGLQTSTNHDESTGNTTVDASPNGTQPEPGENVNLKKGDGAPGGPS